MRCSAERSRDHFGLQSRKPTVRERYQRQNNASEEAIKTARQQKVILIDNALFAHRDEL
jgi:hypothetical protein